MVGGLTYRPNNRPKFVSDRSTHHKNGSGSPSATETRSSSFWVHLPSIHSYFFGVCLLRLLSSQPQRSTTCLQPYRVFGTMMFGVVDLLV